MQKGKIIENIKFLIKQYEKEIEYSKTHKEDYPDVLLEEYDNIIIELKFILELEGIDYDKER